jgi:hypothetical protein
MDFQLESMQIFPIHMFGHKALVEGLVFLLVSSVWFTGALALKNTSVAVPEDL